MNKILYRSAVLACGLAAIMLMLLIALPFLADEFGLQIGPLWPVLSVATIIIAAIGFIYILVRTIRQLWRRINRIPGERSQ